MLETLESIHKRQKKFPFLVKMTSEIRKVLSYNHVKGGKSKMFTIQRPGETYIETFGVNTQYELLTKVSQRFYGIAI